MTDNSCNAAAIRDTMDTASMRLAPRHRGRIPGGWINWHIARGRMAPARANGDLRRMSWRRAI